MSTDPASVRVSTDTNRVQPIVINLGNTVQPGFSGQMVALSEKTWVTADGKTPVADGDPRAAILLGLPGDEITIEQALELGLIDPDEEVEEISQADATTEAEKLRSPTKNKQRQPADNK